MPKKIEYMPNEYKGETYFDKHNGTYSRKWNEQEIKEIHNLLDVLDDKYYNDWYIKNKRD